METNPKNLTKTEDSDKFYAELDRAKIHQSCCTCQTLAILFFALFLILGSGIFYIYYQVTREKVFSFKLPAISFSDFSRRMDNLKADQTGQIEITLTDQDVTALLSEGLSVQSFLLKEIQAQIIPDEMLIYGHLVKPLKSKVVMSAVPVVENGKLNFKITGLTAGNFNFPEFINNQVSQTLNNSVDTKLAPIYQKFTITQINLEDGRMILKGKTK